MWDGLKELIWEIIKEAWCWILESLFDLAIEILKFVSAFFPEVPVPEWLKAPQWSEFALQMIAWLIPTGAIFWAVSLFAVWSISDILAVYIYRSLLK